MHLTRPVPSLVALLPAVLTAALAAQGKPIGFEETWALAADRSKAVALLIPGSSDWFYYRCRERQDAGDLAAVPAALADWTRLHPDDRQRRTEIENRQALLGFTTDPAGTFTFLQHRLGLRFDAVRSDAGAPPDLPTRLDPALIARETLSQKALAEHHGSLDGFTPSALPWLAIRALDDTQLRQFLVMAGHPETGRPDLPNLPALVVRDLATTDSGGFGTLEVHDKLRLEALDECQRLRPELLLDPRFVVAYLRRLLPSADIDWRLDPRARGVQLARLWAFAQRLAPAFNSLKAHVLFHWLEHDLTQGAPDKARLLAWLQLPRRQDFANRAFAERHDRHEWVGSTDGFPTGLPETGDDETLARTCLEHFFASEDSTEPYAPYLHADWLRIVFAETKLLLGQGDAQRWHTMLGSPDRSRALEQRIEITFAPTLPQTFAADAKVALDVDTKNTPTLLLRTFAIDALRWHQEKGTDVDLSIDLDGLVATHEVTVVCPEPKVRRVRRHFDLPQLDRPGTYVVECVGNGLRSRVLIHKGQLRCVERPTAAGHVFRIYDEAGVQVKDAALWFGGRDYTANGDGEILVPHSTEPGERLVVLHRGERSSLGRFSHLAEQYSLHAFCHVDRETLIAGARARLLVRPRLQLAGRSVSLALLKEPVLMLVATDLDGISTTETVRNVTLVDESEFVHEFAVPVRLANLAVMVSGTVKDMRGTDVPLFTAPNTFAVNGNDATPMTHGVQLVRTTRGYALELRGKNGEPKGNRALSCKLRHDDFREPVLIRLRTDTTGRIELGDLPGIYDLRCEAVDTWHQIQLPLAAPRATLPKTLHGLAGETLRIPYAATTPIPAREDFSLFGSERDGFGHLAFADGCLEVRDLPAGDYWLDLRRIGATIDVHITAGVRDGSWVVGRERILEVATNHPLHLRKLEIHDGDLSIVVANSTASTRLAVVATRFDAPFSLFARLAAQRQREPAWFRESPRTTDSATGLVLDDEYRYVLERRFAAKFAGNMLRRPSLLLNPWQIERSQSFGGASPGGPGSPGPSGETTGSGSKGGPGGEVHWQHPGALGNLDFLPRPSVTLANLTPDGNGILTVKLADLGDGQIVHVLTLDGEQAVYDTIVRDEQPLQPRARQLATALDGSQHFTEQKRIEFVAAGGTASLGDARSTKVETFDSLAAVHALLSTISQDESLAKFAFVLQWPKLTPAQQQELYSQHACHELHFFLFHKDPAFFAATCKPFLANKHSKTFLDHWLLGDDLRGFLEPWAFARLNLIEKILLAQRLDGPARDGITRSLREALELRPVDPRLLDRLLDQTLAAHELAVAESTDTGIQLPRDYEGRDKALLKQQWQGKADDNPPAADPNMPADKPAEGGESEKLAKSEKAPERGLGDPGDEVREQLRSELARRGEAVQLYRAVEATKLYVEHDYWHRAIGQATPDVVAPNHFWVDYAAAPAGKPFVSTAIVETGGSFLEMMFALSVLDLPFEPGKHEVTADGEARTLRAATPLLLVRKETTRTEVAADLPPLLLGENFFRLDDRYRFENGERRDAFVNHEFLVDVAYGCQVVVTNPTSSKRTTDVLLQIPAGAIPVQKGFWTRGIAVELESYATASIEYAFYFPAAGDFAHYPAHAAEKGKLAAHAEPRRLHVVPTATKVDTSSWEHVSQQGSAAEVLTFLDTHNVQRVELAKVAWRMKDREFFAAMLGKLRARHIYDHTLWSYAVLHRDADAAREYLQNADGFLRNCGLVLQSPLVTIDPVERKAYQHLELDPLVHARAHRLGGERVFGNADLAVQYTLLMTLLGYQPRLDSRDWLAVTYYLLLQDRTEDAISAFSKIDSAEIHERVQFDYLAAYLCFFTGDTGKARSTAERYRAYPVQHWQKRFADVLSQLDEAEGKVTPAIGEPSADALAASAPALELALEAKNLTVRYRNLAQCEVRYYALDVEFAFSAQPFAEQDGTTAAFVQPNLRETKDLPKDQGELTFELPAQFWQKNVLVEVRGGGFVRSQTFFANALAVRFLESYGQVAVTEPGANTPLPKTYVKVFAKLGNGAVRFHKDGYTDLRGRFDYASVSDDPNAGAVRYAVLVLSEQRGAVIREVAPPTR